MLWISKSGQDNVGDGGHRDGQEFAENFFDSLSANGQGVVYHERSAKALRNATRYDITRHLVAGEISELLVVAEGEERTTWFVWLLVFCSSISGLLFGYDTGVVSGALVSIGSDLGPESLSDLQKELITSATTLGALLGSLGAGMLSDAIGRRPVLGIADILFIGGAVGQAICHTVWAMIGTRFLIGWGVGIAACVAPVVAYGIDAGFANTHGGWRWMVGLGTVPAGLQLFFLFFLPESPRILLKRGQIERARAVMSRIYAHANANQIDFKVKVLQAAVRQSIEITQTTTFMERLHSILFVPVNRRALIVACALQFAQQACGFNTLMYYSATLFKEIGFNQPTAVGLIISGTNFLFTLFALKYIDIIGRRRILLWSMPGMIFGLVLASVAFHFLTRRTGNVLVDGAHYSHAWSGIVLFSMIVFVASYATGLGNVPWQQGELFSLEVRGIGTSLATATNWSINLVIGATYLSLMTRITPSGAFGYTFVIFCFPETAGLSLEESRIVFRNGFGVRESRKLREERAQKRLRASAAAENGTGGSVE
ncbi:general substrate transporter [Multifurca ochricompacta]|uniref:General substrate transporter n=1 Tax=Multifurca ochricompacta TaxID=376703 RepID=A0AAD4M1W7_9AGAM|nr:general substrate transporter [Multifurca ochricompacta]